MRNLITTILVLWLISSGCAGMDINTRVTPQFGCGCQRPMKPKPAEPGKTKKGQHE